LQEITQDIFDDIVASKVCNVFIQEGSFKELLKDAEQMQAVRVLMLEAAYLRKAWDDKQFLYSQIARYTQNLYNLFEKDIDDSDQKIPAYYSRRKNKTLSRRIAAGRRVSRGRHIKRIYWKEADLMQYSKQGGSHHIAYLTTYLTMQPKATWQESKYVECLEDMKKWWGNVDPIDDDSYYEGEPFIVLGLLEHYNEEAQVKAIESVFEGCPVTFILVNDDTYLNQCVAMQQDAPSQVWLSSDKQKNRGIRYKWWYRKHLYNPAMTQLRSVDRRQLRKRTPSNYSPWIKRHLRKHRETPYEKALRKKRWREKLPTRYLQLIINLYNAGYKRPLKVDEDNAKLNYDQDMKDIALNKVTNKVKWWQMWMHQNTEYDAQYIGEEMSWLGHEDVLWLKEGDDTSSLVDPFIEDNEILSKGYVKPKKRRKKRKKRVAKNVGED
jgi:hypothetical protein